jgi:hypothetical protein
VINNDISNGSNVCEQYHPTKKLESPDTSRSNDDTVNPIQPIPQLGVLLLGNDDVDPPPITLLILVEAAVSGESPNIHAVRVTKPINLRNGFMQGDGLDSDHDCAWDSFEPPLEAI